MAVIIFVLNNNNANGRDVNNSSGLYCRTPISV